MITEETIDLYEAIRQMRKLSAEGNCFSFVHATYNRETDTSNGIRHVQQAHLRPAAKGDDLVNADLKIFYFDESIQEPRNCWQMLVMYFNDKRVILN
jgi:hypothetical protein